MIWCRTYAGFFWANTKDDDRLIWVGNKNRVFSVKFFFWLESWDRENQQVWLRKMWNIRLHERYKFLIWKLAHKGLSLKYNLVKRGIQINDVLCLHGCNCVEDKVHVFFSCQFAKGLWFTSP